MDIWIVVLPEGLSRRLWRVLRKVEDRILARSGSVIVARPDAAQEICARARRAGARAIVIQASNARVFELMPDRREL